MSEPTSSEAKHEPNSLDDFHDRFDALAEEAKANGIAVTWALVYEDRLGDDAEMCAGWKGGFYTVLGALHSHIDQIRQWSRTET